MKIFPLLIGLSLTFFSIGQKSYYFSEPLPSSEDKVENVDERHFGMYSASGVARSYEITTDGITIVATNISSIDREMIRESSQYDVRNDHIFGVVEGDSIPCVLEGERYYFGVRSREVLIGSGSSHTLTKIGPGKYILNFYEDGLYTPSIIEFKNSELLLKEFNYELETTIFDSIEKQKSVEAEYHDLVILTPSQEEYAGLHHQIFALSARLKRNMD